jgi:hypothetical protein
LSDGSADFVLVRLLEMLNSFEILFRALCDLKDFHIVISRVSKGRHIISNRLEVISALGCFTLVNNSTFCHEDEPVKVAEGFTSWLMDGQDDGLSFGSLSSQDLDQI